MDFDGQKAWSDIVVVSTGVRHYFLDLDIHIMGTDRGRMCGCAVSRDWKHIGDLDRKANQAMPKSQDLCWIRAHNVGGKHIPLKDDKNYKLALRKNSYMNLSPELGSVLENHRSLKFSVSTWTLPSESLSLKDYIQLIAGHLCCYPAINLGSAMDQQALPR